MPRSRTPRTSRRRRAAHNATTIAATRAAAGQPPTPRPAPPTDPNRWQRRDTDNFTRVQRRIILALSDGRCTLCGTAVTTEPGRPDSYIAGHIIAAENGGRAEINNGRVECAKCSTRDGGNRAAAQLKYKAAVRRNTIPPINGNTGNYPVNPTPPRHYRP